MKDSAMNYLALGDSYTIGELVDEKNNFPHQLSESLKNAGFKNIESPKIIAKTGWTSDELYQHIESLPDLQNNFDLVTLLIGVNDQYRNIDVAVYQKYFLKLLMRAIMFAKGQSRHVYVLSIPDWGVTPFAEKEGKDKVKINSEINLFNKHNKTLSLAYRCHYLDITPLTRHQGLDEKCLTNDLLHYSAVAYGQWVEDLTKLIKNTFQKSQPS